jgi:transposase
MAANIFALSMSTPPLGYERWSVPLLQKKAIEKGIAEFISVKIIYEILKKRRKVPAKPKMRTSKAVYGIDLTAWETEVLRAISEASPAAVTSYSGHTTKKIIRAQILLKLGEKKFTVSEIAALCYTSIQTVYLVFQQYRKEGLVETLTFKQSVANREVGSQIKALRQTKPPDGYSRWTVELLKTTAVERGIVKHISLGTVKHILATQRDDYLTEAVGYGKKPDRNSPLALQPGDKERLEAIAIGNVPAGMTAAFAAQRLVRAKILLLLSEGMKPLEIAETCHCQSVHVYKIRKRYLTQGIEQIIRKRHREFPSKWLADDSVDKSSVAARIIELSRNDPPLGHCFWTVELLQKKAAEMGIAEHIPRAVVTQILAEQAPESRRTTVRVILTAAEKEALTSKTGALRAQILLKLSEKDEAERLGKKVFTYADIARLLHCSPSLVSKVHRCHAKGVAGPMGPLYTTVVP